MDRLPKVTVSIDPGLRIFGAAIFSDDVLVSCDLLMGEQNTRIRGAGAWRENASALVDFIGARSVHDFAYESMQVYAGKYNSDPDDLLELMGVCGACAQAAGAPLNYGYKPREWMKGRGMAANHERIVRRLSGGELRALDRMYDRVPPSKREHVLEAVGVGLFHLRRL